MCRAFSWGQYFSELTASIQMNILSQRTHFISSNAQIIIFSWCNSDFYANTSSLVWNQWFPCWIHMERCIWVLKICNYGEKIKVMLLKNHVKVFNFAEEDHCVFEFVNPFSFNKKKSSRYLVIELEKKLITENKICVLSLNLKCF